MTSYIRFLNITAKDIDISINGVPMILNLSYQEDTPYQEVTSDTTINISVDNCHKELKIKPDMRYTMIYNSEILIYEDDIGCSNFGKPGLLGKLGNVQVRLLNVEAKMPTVDMYLRDNKVAGNIMTSTDYIVGKIDGSPINLTIKTSKDNKTIVGPNEINLVSSGIYSIVLFGTVKKTKVLIVKDANNLACVEDANNLACDKLQEDFLINDYMGKWYLIADLPNLPGNPGEPGLPQAYEVSSKKLREFASANTYETDCHHETAEYTRLIGKIKVINTCYDKNHKMIHKITGYARVKSNSALKVKFPEGKKSKGPNYLIHYTDYDNFSLVGSPSRKSLYILSREPTMEQDLYDLLVEYARKLGYNVDKLKTYATVN